MPKTPPKPKPFATEADLCAAFIVALPAAWTSYAETAGWDILLVRKPDGFQVGIQAKLRLNAEVFAQALEDHHDVKWRGPDCRAILVPWADCTLGLGCFSPYCGITIIRMPSQLTAGPARGVRRRVFGSFEPDLPKHDQDWSTERHWFEMAPLERCRLPEYVPDVPAGARAPLQLTEWKIKALKIAVLLEDRGFVTRADFAHLDIDHRRWLAAAWSEFDRVGLGKMIDQAAA